MKTLLLVLFLWLPSLGWASPDYQALVDDIQQRLDSTVGLYRQGQADAAKQEIQGAYFEVFENLEGPIRINLSADKSYQLEAAFGEIRQLIMDDAPLERVQTRADWLSGQLAPLPGQLVSGHQLVAEQTLANDAQIAPYWQQQLKTIDDLLAEAIYAYRSGDAKLAAERIQQAQYDGFKNSELEIAVRSQRSGKLAASINRDFKQLIDLVRQPGQLRELAYRVPLLLQQIADSLPGLAAPQPEQTGQPQDAGAGTDWSAVNRQIVSALQGAIELYQRGEIQAATAAVQDSYFDLFEGSGLENRLGARDVAAKTELERHFTRLVSQIQSGRDSAELEAEVTALASALEQAQTRLGGVQQGFTSLLLYSLMIIVREGLEALLIVTAIIAYLVKNRHQDKLGLIRNAVGVALVASLATAWLLQALFSQAAVAREILEGATMLVATLILFFMSYWLLAKVEARRWQAYLEGKLSASLTAGSLAGLWLACFLAVYREGAETALFYHALLGDGGASTTLAVALGFVIGCGVLLLVYLLMRFTAMRLPLKPFFMVTGSLLYLMAFTFAGNGVLELIEGKLIEPTLLSGWPQLPWLGIHPYVETLLPQSLLLLAALFALWVMKGGRRAAYAT